jgi:hypothetical protein
MPVTPAFGRLRQKDLRFHASLGYIAKFCLKNPKMVGLVEWFKW